MHTGRMENSTKTPSTRELLTMDKMLANGGWDLYRVLRETNLELS